MIIREISEDKLFSEFEKSFNHNYLKELTSTNVVTQTSMQNESESVSRLTKRDKEVFALRMHAKVQI